MIWVCMNVLYMILWYDITILYYDIILWYDNNMYSCIHRYSISIIDPSYVLYTFVLMHVSNISTDYSVYAYVLGYHCLHKYSCTNKHISSMKRMCKKHVWKNHAKRQPGTTTSHVPKESNGSATSLNSVDFWRCQAVVKLSTCRFFIGHENPKKRHGTICTFCILFSEVLHPIHLHNLPWMWLVQCFCLQQIVISTGRTMSMCF